MDNDERLLGRPNKPRRDWVSLLGLRDKTLWDLWVVMGPLLISATIAWAATEFDARSAAAQRQIEDDRAREDVLQSYIQDMTGLMLDRRLATSKQNQPVRSIARSRTLTAVRQLDADRKGILLQFLYESNLIGTDIVPPGSEPAIDRIVYLNGADLSSANLSGAGLVRSNLTEANLSHTNLTGADLSFTSLSEANLSYAILIGADLSNAGLIGAELNIANLTGADLWSASLTNADLSYTYLSGANLYYADLIEANLSHTSLSEANLSNAGLIGATLDKADLKDANLSDADLSGANLSGARDWTNH
jgi:uncharacterized protein YjbI with pentapeptide repeats